MIRERPGRSLAARGAFGTSWTRKGWTIGVSAQAYGGSRVTYANADHIFRTTIFNVFNIEANGGAKVPPQVYFDGDFAYRAPFGAGKDLIYRLGVRNAFDRKPPLVATSINPASVYNTIPAPDGGLGYSTLGDPRGRRFVASIEMRF